jgi:anti-sigma-K factor RskA
MSAHEPFADDLALYALGSLSGAEKDALEKHLESCAACRNELDALRGDAALLALSATGPAAPARSRERFIKAIAREQHPRTVRRRRSFFELLPVAAAVVMLLITILLWRENVKLRRRVDYAKISAQENEAKYAKAREIMEMMTAPDAAHFTLAAEKEPPHPYGRAIYMPKHGHVLFMATNLGQLPAGKTYELWLLPMSGGKPVPAGMFRPDQKGNAMMMDPCCPPGTEAKGFAVTVENEGGSSTPTMPIEMVGTGT